MRGGNIRSNEKFTARDVSQHVNISFDLEFRVNVNSEKEVKTFLSDLNSSTCCSFNIQSGRQDRRPKGDKARSSIRGYCKCCLYVLHSEGKESRQPGKIKDCQASINFRLENPVGQFNIIKDERYIGRNMHKNIHYLHNCIKYKAH